MNCTQVQPWKVHSACSSSTLHGGQDLGSLCQRPASSACCEGQSVPCQKQTFGAVIGRNRDRAGWMHSYWELVMLPHGMRAQEWQGLKSSAVVTAPALLPAHSLEQCLPSTRAPNEHCMPSWATQPCAGGVAASPLNIQGAWDYPPSSQRSLSLSLPCNLGGFDQGRIRGANSRLGPKN